MSRSESPGAQATSNRQVFTSDELDRSRRSEAAGPFEVTARWELAGYRGQDTVVRLRSGIALYASTCQWDQAGAIASEHTPSPRRLTFMISRGPGMRVVTDEGHDHVAGGQVSLSRVYRAHRARYESSEGALDEVVCLGIERERLIELLGTPDLPSFLAEAPGTGHVSSQCNLSRRNLPMTPALFTLLDEVSHCDARGVSRKLYLEAKGLELLARLSDTFEQAEEDSSPILSRSDIDRLQRARALLLSRLDAPPSLPALARAVGLNEAKLKSGFRTLFGAPAYTYLRRARLQEAHRMLLGGELNVTEVAGRVGYENPSKFAAAFRKQFGASPSSVSRTTTRR